MSVAMPGLGLGGPPLLTMGTPEQKERFLAPFHKGFEFEERRVPAVVDDEIGPAPSGHTSAYQYSSSVSPFHTVIG